MATTSNGNRVDSNMDLAEKAYLTFKKTGSMPESIGTGTAAAQINAHMKVFNSLRKEWGPETLRKFMESEFSVAGGKS